jgi:hypothetical protein
MTRSFLCRGLAIIYCPLVRPLANNQSARCWERKASSPALVSSNCPFVLIKKSQAKQAGGTPALPALAISLQHSVLLKGT